MNKWQRQTGQCAFRGVGIGSVSSVLMEDGSKKCPSRGMGLESPAGIAVESQ